MRKLGEVINPRDERNWRVPRVGTKRRQIYDALVSGQRSRDIKLALGLTQKAYLSHRRCITSWSKTNANSLAASQR